MKPWATHWHISCSTLRLEPRPWPGALAQDSAPRAWWKAPRACPWGSTWGDARDCNNCGKIPSKSGGEHGVARSHRAFGLSKVSRLLPIVGPWSKIAALHRRRRADRRQFLGLPGVSRHPPLPAVFRERQSRRDGRRLGFKLGRFQRRKLAHRAAGLRMVERVMDAYGRRQQRKKSGLKKEFSVQQRKHHTRVDSLV